MLSIIPDTAPVLFVDHVPLSVPIIWNLLNLVPSYDIVIKSNSCIVPLYPWEPAWTIVIKYVYPLINLGIVTIFVLPLTELLERNITG